MKKLTNMGKWFFTITTLIFTAFSYLIQIVLFNAGVDYNVGIIICGFCWIWICLGQFIVLKLIWSD